MDGLPYHRLARTVFHRWWRPLLAVLVAGGGWVVATFAVLAGYTVVALLAGEPFGDDLPSLGERADLAVGLISIILLLPASMLAARWVQRRPAGTLSSVLGRIRWGLLLRFLLPALAVPVVALSGGMLLTAVTGGDTGTGEIVWPGLTGFLLSTALLVLLVPLQAAAEEYGFRGLLLQSLGSVLRGPWIPIAVQAVLFAAMHGWGTPWGFADLVVFGVVAGYLTVRTGGLEAAVALHVMNNLVAFVALAGTGDLSAQETAADMPWQVVAVDVPVLIAYALIALWIARRNRAATRLPLLPPPPAPHQALPVPQSAESGLSQVL